MARTVPNRRYLCPAFRPCMMANVVAVDPKGYFEERQSPMTGGNRVEVNIPTRQETTYVDQSTSSLPTENEAPTRPPVDLENPGMTRARSERKVNNILDWLKLFPAERKPIWEGWGRGKSSNGSRALFPTQEATGGFLKSFGFGDSAKQNDSTTSDAETLGNANNSPSTQVQFQDNTDSTNEPTKHSFPSWSTWKDWKKISIDLYFRLTDSPRDSRVRLKQTLALLPIVKIKPIIDLKYNGPNQPPISMRLDLKFLDCVKYMIQPDGNSVLQVRAKAPLSDPRFMMDVVYEREMKSFVDTVKISFRAMDIAFLKAPGFGFGFRFPLRFNNGIKITIGTKKYFGNTNSSQHVVNTDLPQHGENQYTRRRRTARSVSHSHQTSDSSWKKPWLQIHGPTKIDVKIRCLEYR